jgi:hypothetical protein
MSSKTNEKNPYSLLPTTTIEEEQQLLPEEATPQALYGRLNNVWVYSCSILNIACLSLNVYLLLISLHYEPSHLQESYCKFKSTLLINFYHFSNTKVPQLQLEST